MESPVPSAWSGRRAGYVTLAWDTATGWSGLLDGMALFADAIAPTITTAIVNAVSPTTANPPTLTLSSVDPDVAEARVYLAETIAGVTYMYGVVGVGPVLPSIDYQFVWDGTMLGLADGTNVSEITVLPWIGGASPIYVAPGTLSSAGASVEAFAVLDSSTTAVTTLFTVEAGRLSSQEVSAFRGATFTPRLWNLTASAFQPATALTIPNVVGASLTLSWGQVAAGDYHLVTQMADVWGNVGSVLDNVTVVTPF
jgi:hypothetical protein